MKCSKSEGTSQSSTEVESWGYPSHLDILSSVSTRLSEDHKQLLDSPFQEDEVRQIMFQMNGMKSPAPDGIVAAFYQKHWNLIGPDVTKSCLSFLKLWSYATGGK